MNILFLNRYQGPHLYGIERWMVRMSVELANRGHTVHLACKAGTRLHREAQERGVPVWPFIEKPGLGWITILSLRRFLQRQSIATVCVKTWKEVFWTAGAGHGLDIQLFCRRGNSGDVPDRLWPRLAVTFCQPHILVPSSALGREVAAIPWMQGRPLHVVSHGVEMDEFKTVPAQTGLPECNFRFIFVGRLSPAKGVDILLRAWPRVLARAPGSRLLLVGGHEDVDYVAMAHALGIANSIDFAGYQKNVKPWIAAAQAMVLPSRREGGGLVILEAMALGLPVIGSNVGGIPEYVQDGRTGTIVPVADDIALAEAMTALALAPACAQAQGIAGRQRVTNEFSLQTSTKTLERAFCSG